MKSLLRDYKVYRQCPEIRFETRQVFVAKIAATLTMVFLSPLLLLGIIAIGIVHTFDYLGQLALWPAHRITDWLHEYQRETIRSAHSKLSIEEIKERTGISLEDEEPEKV